MSNYKSSDDSKVLNNTRLIAGYLRDAALSNNPFILTVKNQEILANLIHIEENSARGKDEKRRIHLQVVGVKNVKKETYQNIEAEEIFFNKSEVSCRIAWDRNLIKFNTTLIYWEEDNIVIESPNIAGIISSRKKYRFNVNGLTVRSSLVSILKNSNTFCFSYFRIEDISSDGVGGVLESDYELPDLPLYVNGKLRQDVGEIQLSGQIIRIERLEKSYHSKFRYKVGIKNNTVLMKDNSSNEKRIAKRISVNIPIEVKSPVNDKINITLEVKDLSYSGISAQLFNNADVVMFKVGMRVLMLSPELQLKVVSVDENIIRFKVLPSYLSEHIQLFNLKSKIGERDLAIKTPIPEDILQVYSVSGSLSSGLIKNIRLYRENILNSLETNTHTKPWFLRWMQQSDNGRIKSIIMTVPYGENLWYCGGAAGHLDPSLKTSADFFSRYFNANIDFFKTLSSNEYIAFNWFLDNERWDDWESDLSEQKQDRGFFRFDGDIIYFKESTLSSNDIDLTRNVLVDEIKQGQFNKINNSLACINHKNLKQFVGQLGLNTYSFGGNSVKDILQYSSKDFNRKCYYIKIEEAEIITVISNYPSYCSPNGILNYPFVLSSTFLNEEQMNLLTYELLKITTEHGIECHGIFLTMNGRVHNINETKNLYLRKIRWTFGPAEKVWRYWKDNEK